jgi:hypothetical protein
MEAETLSAQIFQECFLVEFEIAEDHLLALANTVPAEQYSWRPNPATKSICEIFLDVAAGNLLILETIGHPAPQEIYPDLPDSKEERIWQVLRQNDRHERTVRDKDRVVELLQISLSAVRASIPETTPGQNSHRIIRRAYMRLLANCHEQMGQEIAYVRSMGLAVPWEDDAVDLCRVAANGYLH